MAGRIESAPAAERYFCTLSPLCKRIISNVQTIRSLHADDWNDLTYADRCDVIDGHMVNQETADHWRRVSRQPGDGAPSNCTTATPKLVEDEDPDTGQVVRWRDEHAAPFSWRTASQERIATAALDAHSEWPVRRQPFLARDSIKHRLSRVEHLYDSYSPKRTVADGFDSPSLVLGGSSGGSGGSAPPIRADAATGRSLKQQVLTRLVRGRRVLLSITRLGKQPAAAASRRLDISPPEISAPHRQSVSTPRPATVPATSPSYRRPQVPPPPPPPPPVQAAPVQAALVPIRTSAAHRQSVRSASQYAAPWPQPPPSPPPPTAGARSQPTPPQLKRVPPPVVPRRDSITPERDVAAERRADGDGSELGSPPHERAPPPPTPQRRQHSPQPQRRQHSPQSQSRKHSPQSLSRQHSPQSQSRQHSPQSQSRQHSLQPQRRQHSPKPQRRQHSPQPQRRQHSPQPQRRQHSPQSQSRKHSPQPQSRQHSPPVGSFTEPKFQLEEPMNFHSVLERPSQVEMKTGFDFLDNW